VLQSKSSPQKGGLLFCVLAVRGAFLPFIGIEKEVRLRL